MTKYSVLIIGAGKIGAFLDTPQSETVLTHANAFNCHPGFILRGFVDADREKAERAALLWGTEAFDSVTDAFARHAIDIAVVAVPDEAHYQLLLELADRPLKLVFVEKPLAKSRAEGESIVRLYHEGGIGLAVNYSRRFVHAFVDLRDRIARGEFGRYLTGAGYYGKGTLHNGSHMVDLLCFLLGEPIGMKALGAIRDWSDDDPTCSVLLEIAEGCQFVMQGLDCRCYTLFEMDLLFEKARVRLVDSGFALELYGVIDSGVFAGYRVLSAGKRHAVDLSTALYEAAVGIYGHLSAGRPLACTGDDGLRTLAICTDIIGALG
jgi:predicted dehydrogenase